MAMSSGLRKLALTSHVISSVGWFGAVASFLVLAVVGLNGEDAQLVRAVYLAMKLITWWLIVPLAFAALLSGVVQSLGTEWGLFRHYWVLAKFVITILATVLLLVHTKPIGYLADLAKETTISSANAEKVQIQMVADSALALVALLATTVLAIYKPRGLTPYGWRKQRERRRAPAFKPDAD